MIQPLSGFISTNRKPPSGSTTGASGNPSWSANVVVMVSPGAVSSAGAEFLHRLGREIRRGAWLGRCQGLAVLEPDLVPERPALPDRDHLEQPVVRDHLDHVLVHLHQVAGVRVHADV